MLSRDADKIANTVDPDQIAPLWAVRFGSALFAQTCVSKKLEQIARGKYVYFFSSVRNYVVQTLTGDGLGNETDTMVYINLVGTLGDSGKRFLVHNMEENERKFQTGQVRLCFP